MTIQEIRNTWNSNRVDPQSAVELWNSKAASYSSKELPTAENSLAMRLILEHEMIGRGQTALDVGCGSGRFSFALEQLGACVTGTDFSPRMIGECEKAKKIRQSGVDFSICDWHNADLQALGWKGHFDLVLANMTPAVVSAETFLRLSEAGRNWCLMVKPTRRKNEILDLLTDMLGLKADTKGLDETIIYAFELLWLNGLKPRIDYEEQTWEHTWTTEEAVREYTLRISSSHVLSDPQREEIAEFLRHISCDGMVKERTRTTITAVYWQV
ncbi:MAG: class I SAM-dependent methyltransferase [Clostridiales bacterium]|nr:class I SAM-dependent methyltransferase [Clostridiales bacterium]